MTGSWRPASWLGAWLVVSACAGKPSRMGPTEYEVLSLPLKRDSVVMADSTDAVCADFCDWKESTPAPTAWADFVANNRRPAAIDRAAFVERRVRVVRAPAAGTPACHGPWTVSISRAGFDPDTTQAIIEYRLSTGVGSDPACRTEGGVLLLTRRPGRGWRGVRALDSWLSRRGRNAVPQRTSQHAPGPASKPMT